MATALSLKFFVLLLSILATFVMAQDCGYCKNCMKARTEQIRDYESQSILAKVSHFYPIFHIFRKVNYCPTIWQKIFFLIRKMIYVLVYF